MEDTMRKDHYNITSNILLILALALFVIPAAAQDSVSLYWENDGTFVKPNGRTDRHYTNGTKIVYTTHPNDLWLKDFGQFNDFAKSRKVETAFGYFIGQNIYTPDNADNPAIRGPRDRVFAGWFYGGVFAQRAAGNEMEHFEINLGVIGPSAQADEAQRIVHEVVHANAPEGWETQLKDEFAIDVAWQKRHVIESANFTPTKNFDLIAEYGFTAGSVHRSANLGMILRCGINIPRNFGPGRLEMPADFARIDQDTGSFYGFGRASIKFIEHNRFLTGLSEEPVVSNFQLGVIWQYKSFEVSYSQTFMSHQYEEQVTADSFGSLNFTYYF